MALIKCPECDKEISDQAKICPNCGCPVKSKKRKGLNKKVLIVVLSICVIFGIGCFAFYKFKPAEKINIVNCMTTNPVSKEDSISELGTPDEQTIKGDDFYLTWYNYSLVDNYSGELKVVSYISPTDEEYTQRWSWTLKCDKSGYEKILSLFEEKYGDGVDYPTDEAKVSFFKVPFRVNATSLQQYYRMAIAWAESEEILIVDWGELLE